MQRSPDQNSSPQNIAASRLGADSHRSSWAVVGSGMMGLITALRLVERGQRITLFESSSAVGGLTSSWKLPICGNESTPSNETVVEWDKYYHVILLSDSRIRSVLQMLGLDDKIEWVQTKTAFYSAGKIYPLSNSLDFLKFPPLTLYQKLRLGGTIFLGSKIRNWRLMEKMLVEDWLRRWSGNSTYEKIWKPLLKAKLGRAYERTAASFIWAYIDRMYKARRTGMKRELFGYVPGGYKQIIRGLEKHLKDAGVEIILNATVQRVFAPSQDPRHLQIDYGSNSGTQSQGFDRVIMTSPYQTVDRVCDTLSDEEKKRLRETEYLGVICTSLLLDNPLTGYYVTNIIDDWVPLTGIIEMGSIVPPEKLNGSYLVYLPQYMPSNDLRFDESDENIHERCLNTLEKMYPDTFCRSSVKVIQSARARCVMALPTLNFSENRPPVVLSEAGLYLLNSARIVKGTLNVNETLELLEEEFNGVIWPNHLSIASGARATDEVNR